MTVLLTEFDVLLTIRLQCGHAMIMSLLSQTACYFYLQPKVFLQDWLRQDYFLGELLFSMSHSDSPIMEVSDIGQLST